MEMLMMMRTLHYLRNGQVGVGEHGSEDVQAAMG